MSKPNSRIANTKVMVVSENQNQRLAFSDTVRSCGLTLVDCVSPLLITQKHLKVAIDVWLIDSQYDDDIVRSIEANQPDTVMVGFSHAPYLNETQLYARWQRKLKRKLAQMLDLPELVQYKRYHATTQSWRYVVLLGASTGGPAAVKSFLDKLSPQLPICILLAHHFSPQMIHTLPRILNRHNDWRCQVIATTQSLQAGQCLIAPIEQQITCDSTGRVFLVKEPWIGEYKPSISALQKNASDVFGSDLISIIFSGMGYDGSEHLELTHSNGSQIWAQNPELSACPSQPQAVIDSGFCQFVGNPEELAERLTQYVTESA